MFHNEQHQFNIEQEPGTLPIDSGFPQASVQGTRLYVWLCLCTTAAHVFLHSGNGDDG